MPVCAKSHGKDTTHEYVKGICIHTVSLGARTWLLTTYPWSLSHDYEASKGQGTDESRQPRDAVIKY